MGAIKYVSSRSNTPTGDWNEGFVFVVSFHAQLFNTIEARKKKRSLENEIDLFSFFLIV
ncbi:uncharacterized protein BX664DRAFT_254058 [Halteromyces radiatus]|uniref:uncharacterized protein n=1 Tax=Halteromyces radiatus TaxID=101107 RepID=UPI00221FE053|nr:uncharacterized protein BX664DRAFT_254058 [Halteromyces radiatus]KAI8098988.1 hypothetical protein BX664DRAFT_254058 [Halteromyces radiatus]